MTTSEVYSRISSAPWFEIMSKLKVLIAGLGGIGSNVAYSISRLGISHLYLMDNDTVSSGNINGQLYKFSDVGRKKTYAIAQTLCDFSLQRTSPIDSLLTPYVNLSYLNNVNAIITGFDNMEARKTAYNFFRRMITYSSHPILLIDGRMTAEEFQVFCLSSLPEDEYRFERYEKDYLFNDNEAEPTICSFKQTSFVSQMIGGVITNLFVNFFSNVESSKEDIFIPRSVPFITEYSADSMILSSKDN